MKSLAIAAAAAVLLTAAPAAAQVALEANVAKSEGDWGAELGAGMSVISYAVFRLKQKSGVFLADRDDDRYFLDSSATPAGCRDTVPGTIFSHKRCDPDPPRLSARAAATFDVPLAGISVGTGARFMSGNLRPYGTISAAVLPLVNVKANAGPKYVAAGLQARF